MSERLNPNIYNITYKCPEHKTPMIRAETRYGLRFGCRHKGCDYVAWVSFRGEKSTPANAELRKARTAAHVVFDKLWKGGRFSRPLMYKALSNYLGRKAKKTHIRLFDMKTCQRVHDFAGTF